MPCRLIEALKMCPYVWTRVWMILSCEWLAASTRCPLPHSPKVSWDKIPTPQPPPPPPCKPEQNNTWQFWRWQAWLDLLGIYMHLAHFQCLCLHWLHIGNDLDVHVAKMRAIQCQQYLAVWKKCRYAGHSRIWGHFMPPPLPIKL